MVAIHFFTEPHADWSAHVSWMPVIKAKKWAGWIAGFSRFDDCPSHNKAERNVSYVPSAKRKSVTLAPALVFKVAFKIHSFWTT